MLARAARACSALWRVPSCSARTHNRPPQALRRPQRPPREWSRVEGLPGLQRGSRGTCACGCGVTVGGHWRNRRRYVPALYVRGHNKRGWSVTERNRSAVRRRHDGECVSAEPIQRLFAARGMGPTTVGRLIGITAAGGYHILTAERLRRSTAVRILAALASLPRSPSRSERTAAEQAWRRARQRERKRRKRREDRGVTS